MKNSRTILRLLAALAITALLHLLLSYKGGFESALVHRTSLIDAQPESISKIVIARAGQPSATLVRTTFWRLVEPYSALVDTLAIMKVLDALATSDVQDAIDEQELLRLGRTREDFGLDSPRARVTISWEDGTEEISIGSATPSGDGAYAAIAGEPTVYVVSSNVFASVDVPPSGFRRRTLFSVGEESAQALDIKRGSGSFMRFVCDGEMWKMVQPREAAASSVKIRSLIAGVMSASATDFVWPTGAPGESATATSALLAGYGLDPESAVTVTVKCADGMDRQISFGNEAKEGLVYALAHNASAVVTVTAALKEAALAESSEFTDTRLFPIEADAVFRVSVTDGETTYLLAKRDSKWFLDAPVAAATDPEGVDTLVKRLLALKLSDVAAEGVTVSLTTNIAPAVVSREAAFGEQRPESLRSREILRVEPSALKRIVVTGGKDRKPTSVVYDRDRRAWNVESSSEHGVVSSEAVDAFSSAVNPLVADSIVKLKVSAADMRAYGLDAPRFTVAIDQFKDDAVRRNVLIGEVAPGGGSYATLGAADAVFVLPAKTVARLTAPLVTK